MEQGDGLPVRLGLQALRLLATHALRYARRKGRQQVLGVVILPDVSQLRREAVSDQGEMLEGPARLRQFFAREHDEEPSLVP